MLIRHTDIVALFAAVNSYIRAGYQVTHLRAIWEWRVWRYVRVYHAYVTQLKPEQRLEFQWGPVSERPIPQGPEFGDC